tara:strand:+ start:154 stop:699 length:546 start_codon:yes stop_codon:yes gene_type:complete
MCILPDLRDIAAGGDQMFSIAANQMSKNFLLIVVILLIGACASKEEIAERKKEKTAKLNSMSVTELCSNVRIQNWPPTWRGGKGVFWYAMETDYRAELISRGVGPFTCSNASKRCVSYGFTLGTNEHRNCAVAEGANITVQQIEADRQRSEEYKAIFGTQDNQPSIQEQIEPYLMKRKPIQ